MFVIVVMCFMSKHYPISDILLELESSMNFAEDRMLVFQISFLCLKSFPDFVEAMTCFPFFLTNFFKTTSGRAGYVR